MVRYELLAHRSRRWEVDGLHEDKQTAVEEARTLVERDPLVSAVRVMMIENGKNGIAERQVCTVRALSSRVSTPLNGSRGPAAPHPARRDNGPSPQRKGRQGEALLAAAVIVAAVVMLCYGVMLPKQPWAFDLPDAQNPHLIRDIFTGTYSQAPQ